MVDDRGQASFEVDNMSNASKVIDNWFAGFPWLPKHAGHLANFELLSGLPDQEHELTVTVLNRTNSPNGGHTFQIRMIAVV